METAMTKMTDMGQKWDEPSVVSEGGDEKYYPTLYLGKKQMKATGLSGAGVGSERTMIAKVRVRSISDSATGGGSMDLEIIEACFEEASKADSASILYGDGDKD